MKNLTGYIIVATILIIGAYDIYVLIQGGLEATISHVTLTAATSYPIIPFAVGVICGHLFWPQKKGGD